jgi:hypothetical protein
MANTYINFNGYILRKEEVLYVEPMNEDSCRVMFKDGIQLEVSLVQTYKNRKGITIEERIPIYKLYQLLELS